MSSDYPLEDTIEVSEKFDELETMQQSFDGVKSSRVKYGDGDQTIK
ncbi:MAG: hypothetical protein ACTSQK_10860 [Candidatus Heimdallarchaeota archaeon]